MRLAVGRERHRLDHRYPCPGSLSADVQGTKLPVFTHVFLAVLDGSINETGILGLFRRSENQRRVCGGILWLVLVDCFEVSVLNRVRSQNYTYWQNHLNRRQRPISVLAMLDNSELRIRTVPVALSCSNEFVMVVILV